MTIPSPDCHGLCCMDTLQQCLNYATQPQSRNNTPPTDSLMMLRVLMCQGRWDMTLTLLVSADSSDDHKGDRGAGL